MLEKMKKELKQVKTIIGDIIIDIEREQINQIHDIFDKHNSPFEMIQLFKKLDLKIRQINDGVSFRTTENSLTYQIYDQNFMAIYPQVKALRVEYLIPDGWGNYKLIDDAEIDDVIVLIEESYYLMRERKE